MITFLAQRAVHLTMLVSAIALLTFAAGALTPGTYEQAFRLEPGFSMATVADLRSRHGLDKPFVERLAAWAGSAARGDFGVSVEYDAPVAPLVIVRAGRTVLLGLVAASFAWLAALPMGVLMAARADSTYDRIARAALAVLLALPEPVLAIGLLMVAAATGWAPAGGMWSVRDTSRSMLSAGGDLAWHLAVPAAVLALGLLPTLVRHVRSSIVAVLAAPFVTAARARGVPERRLLLRGVLRVAATPLVSLLGLSMASLISASLLVEVVTGWPGLGPLLVEATRSRDIPVVLGVGLCSVVLLAVGTSVAELAARVADPRTRVSTRAGHD
jgi:peptide/nickel transport system permease protein